MSRASRKVLKYATVLAVCLTSAPFALRGPGSAVPADAPVRQTRVVSLPATPPATRPAAPAHKLIVDTSGKRIQARHPLAPTTMPQEPAPLATLRGEMPQSPTAAPPAPKAPASSALAAAINRLPGAHDWLPPANPLVAPRRLSTDGLHAAAATRSLDLPAHAFESSKDLPAAIVLPAGALVSAPSPDTERLFARFPQTVADPHAVAYVDPTGGQSAATSIAADPPMRQTPAPFTVYSIPQPRDPSAAVWVPHSVPDADGPVCFWDLPARPPMTVAK